MKEKKKMERRYEAEEDLPFLPVLPSRSECLAASVFGAAYCVAVTAPLWWEYGDFPILGAMIGGTAACYTVLRLITEIRWHRHCAVCRAITNPRRRGTKRANTGNPVWLREAESRRRRDTFGGYVPRDVICAAAKGKK